MNEQVAQPDEEAGATEPREVPEDRAALVKRWVEKVKGDKKHWKSDFDRMDKCIQLAAEGADKAWVDGDQYVVPIVLRHINQAVATLYHRHPKVIAKRKSKLLYQLWDGDPATLQQAMAAAQPQVDPATGLPVVDETGQPLVDANAVALLQEVEAAKQHMVMLDRMGRTQELLFDHYLSEQDAGYKEQIKAVVRRGKVTGVGYIKLGFQRELGKDPEIETGIADITSKIEYIEGLMQKQARPDADPEGPDIEDLRIQLEDLQSRVDIIVREGPVLSFPRADEIIPDRNCRHLKTFTGANHVAHEFHMTPDRVLEVYGIDLRKEGFQHYRSKGDEGSEKKDAKACVWEVWDKVAQQVFTICDGYKDFLREPSIPSVQVDRFWTLFPVVFNEAEGRVYPISDVWAARHMQKEYNASREGLREHRIANRPKYASAKGRLEDDDKTRLASAAAHEIIELNSLSAGEKVGDLLQVIKHAPIDPALYETESTFQDIQRAVGSQEANLGGTSGATATETSIAENSRMSASADNVDDLDSALTALARAMGQLMMLELDIETVRGIAGPGAVWPEMSREEIAKEVMLEVEAGSSGRPNKAAEMANLERAMPYVIQLPGVNPMPLVKKYGRLLDLDPEDLIVEGLPSIVANNQASPFAGSDPNAAPENQGGEGVNNAPAVAAEEPGAQPAYPAPSAGTAVQPASI